MGGEGWGAFFCLIVVIRTRTIIVHLEALGHPSLRFPKAGGGGGVGGIQESLKVCEGHAGRCVCVCGGGWWGVWVSPTHPPTLQHDGLLNFAVISLT